MLLPGATNDHDWWKLIDDAAHPDGDITKITDAGFPVGTIGTLDTWGNPTQVANISTLISNMRSSGLARGGRVHLFGVSAGGLSAIQWARENPQLVATLQLLIPAHALQNTYDENRSGFQSVIGTAYGGRPTDDDDPLINAAELRGLKIRMYVSDNDAVTTPGESHLFAERSGAERISMGSVGHFWGAPYNGAAIADYIAANDG